MEQFDYIETEKKYLMQTYKRSSFVLEHGKGSYVWDTNGNKYLDMIGGVATCSIGHSNPTLVKAIFRQAEKLINASNLFYTEPQLALAKKLSEISGLDKCFFSNSGSEAVEAAIKLAKKVTKKSKIIAMKNGFHGRTLGSLSATWKESYKAPFSPLIPGFEHVDYGDIDALQSQISEDTAAVILEPIQGEAGVIVPPPGYLKKVEELCKKNNILLILDEIQTGNGRTGKYFCFQHEDISPDIITLAKGIANGLPIGVTLSKRSINFNPGDHGSTFGGNSLCCAAALKTIELIENILLDVEPKGNYFMSKLNSIKSDNIKEVRGKGLMVALELNKKDKSIAEKCAKKGLLINCIDEKILRFLPPLTITQNEIDFCITVLESVLVGGDSDD
ncbi:MAG: acetylornithine transaminase [Candidatus Aenigmarchaeota archaeon]|nr:acetylornithine transaminase [Candidatus Aenigmarchaeota archaeon]